MKADRAWNNDVNGNGAHIIYDEKTGKHIAIMCDGAPLDDANLMSAAPELLAALYLVLNIVEGCCDCWNNKADEVQKAFVNCVIDKAKGQK